MKGGGVSQGAVYNSHSHLGSPQGLGLWCLRRRVGGEQLRNNLGCLGSVLQSWLWGLKQGGLGGP